ncbi:MAG: circadian clock protein KaiC [Thermoplasmata archaeon]|nr:MAG: circadian clock protein KaiC [Thermoplasmata archaeon]
MVHTYKSYIRGFDEELGGGIPEYHIILVSGTPGTMKSSVAYNILYHNIKHENSVGIYVSLEQSRENLLFQLESLGQHDIEDLNLTILDMGKIRKEVSMAQEKPWLEVLEKHLNYLKETLDFDLLVIDSLPVLEMISKVEDERTYLFYFFEWLRDLKVTSFIISEISTDPSIVYPEEFLADGIILLTMERVNEVDVHRRIRCVKMRGVNHNTGYFTLEFKDDAFQASQAI